MNLNRRYIFLFFAFIFSMCVSAFAQTSLPDAVTIEKRNAATAFVSVREQFAFALVRECMPHLSQSAPDPLEIVRNWYSRNFAEIEAAQVWLSRYLSLLQQQNSQLAGAAQQAFLQETSRSLLGITRVSFGHKLPDAASCERVLLQLTSRQLDFANMGKQAGFTQFSEFSQTLGDYRGSNGYQVPSTLKFGVTDSQLAASQMVASLVAADAATQAKDADGFLAAYRNMARQGDGKAAQTIGVAYLNGDLLTKDVIQSYRWFYAAFQLAEYEGANALGVMHRDGMARRGNDRVIAQASFFLASRAAQAAESRNRASNNFNRLDSALSADEKHAVGCMRLAQLDEHYKLASELPSPLANVRTISEPQRRLREVMSSSLAGYRTERSCD